MVSTAPRPPARFFTAVYRHRAFSQTPRLPPRMQAYLKRGPYKRASWRGGHAAQLLHTANLLRERNNQSMVSTAPARPPAFSPLSVVIVRFRKYLDYLPACRMRA